MVLFHTTSPEAAIAILEEGFAPSWGDAGYGVYFYDNLADAVRYGQRGGWDRSMVKYMVLSADPGQFQPERITPDPAWTNPEEYDNVLFIPVDQDEDPDGELRLRLPHVAAVAAGARLQKKRRR